MDTGLAAGVVNKSVLMIAYHYPPVQGSSGVQRTLAFSRELPALGWQPQVLTVAPRAYPAVSADLLAAIPDGIAVTRAAAWDAARHLAVRGRYPGLLAWPDRWGSWLPAAVLQGLRLIRRERVRVIWSTYPIATAHLIALVLHRLTGLPWVADFRDAMVDDSYPATPRARRAHAWVEAAAVRECTAAVLTAPGAIELYRQRYPELPASRWRLLPNGYDEASFQAALQRPSRRDPERVTLLHSGIIYPSERDPRALLAALAALQTRGVLMAGRQRIVLRASGHDDYLRPLLAERGLQALVELAPPLPYVEALREMLDADGLLLLQAGNCNHQIPAKLYEYLRAGRPILALTDPAGDTAALLRTLAAGWVVSLDDETAIAAELQAFLHHPPAPVAAATCAAYDRAVQTRALAALLTESAPA